MRISGTKAELVRIAARLAITYSRLASARRSDSRRSAVKALIVAMPPMLFDSRFDSAPDPRPHLGVQRGRASHEEERTPDDHRHRRDREERDARRDDEEHDAHQHHGHADLQDVVRPAVEEALELVDVVVEDRGQLARAARLEERHVLTLHLIVGVLPEIGLQILGEVAPQDQVEVLEQ